MENLDKLFDKMLESTKEIHDAAQRADLEKLGQTIDMRQQYLDRLSGLKAQKMTDEQKSKYHELIILDEEASALIQKLIEEYKNDYKNTSMKYDGLVKYNSSKFNLSSGRMIDKKR